MFHLAHSFVCLLLLSVPITVHVICPYLNKIINKIMFKFDDASSEQFYTSCYFLEIISYIFCRISSIPIVINFENHIQIIGFGSLSNYTFIKIYRKCFVKYCIKNNAGLQ